MAGHVWHLTERCHRQQFLPKFARDRRAWVQWLSEWRTRFGLSVLNYQVTSNHVHRRDRDRGDDAIARSLQLIAGGAVLRDPTAAYGAHSRAEMAAPSEKSRLHSQHT